MEKEAFRFGTTKEGFDDEEYYNESLREGNVSLVLDAYTDIFSDFDPRPFSQRAISDDFLMECKRAVRDSPEGFELRLMVPINKRDIKTEVIVKKRLKNHFEKHFYEKKSETNKVRAEGGLMIILGAVFMLLATFFVQYTGFLFKLLFVISEPAGWFTFWSGLDRLFFGIREKLKEQVFYRKMSTANLYFFSYPIQREKKKEK
jgi:hypothetical protein